MARGLYDNQYLGSICKIWSLRISYFILFILSNSKIVMMLFSSLSIAIITLQIVYKVSINRVTLLEMLKLNPVVPLG